YGQIYGVEYEIVDSEDNVVDYKDLKAGNTYRIRAKIKESEKNHFIFEDGSTETGWQEFSVSANDKLTDPNDPTNPYYPQVDPELPTDSNDPTNDPNGETKNDFDKVIEVLKEWWQVIASAVSIVLIIIFVSKGIGYANKRKQNKKTVESKYSSAYYAVSGTGLFGLSMTNWTIIACILMGVAVLSFVFMLLEKRGFKQSQKELEEAREEFERNQKDIDYRKRESDNQRRDEDLKMILMSMLGGQTNMNNGGGQQQGGYAYAQQGVSADEMRLMINEAVTALLPNTQQYLPQQASTNDEVIKDLIEGQKAIMKKLAEKPAHKEVAATTISDEVLDRLASKLQPVASDETLLKVVAQSGVNDETIKQMLKTQEDLMHNQEKLMEKILGLSANQQPSEPQVIEKIVEVPVEKIVEKEVKVEVPVEVEKIVEVPVEKIVEKEVVKEVPIEVEKVVEKIVEIPAAKPIPKAKVATPRLTLDEAYAKLSAKQKKIFDTLRAYALSKDKSKEKKSTYYILLGQSSVNPLVKLTIKKDTTVALFKMEDEYFKDIRKDAGSEGTKMKIKETELIVGDAQALATAKKMVDLREDQIERYQDYLKEQRFIKK
ncbi:MAG: hypothetical protein K2J89_01325, partial [Clostridia bacterium]|nr:hypothetical protein [Clostridia bacterium]